MNRRTLLLGGVTPLASCARPEPAAVPPVVEPELGPSILEPLFTPGTRVEVVAGEPVPVSIEDAGPLRLPTGRVIAADPSWLPGWEQLGIVPYTVAVPPGSYPVALSVTRSRLGVRVAAARLSIIDSPVAVWEPALRPGQNPAELAPGQYFGVGVDTGCAGFLDAVALQYMAAHEQAGGEHCRELLTRQSAQRTDPASGANYIVFNTGFGDGRYPVWVGRAAAGDVACFTMNMLLARM